MSLFAPNLEKARNALEQATSRHDLLIANSEAHRLAPANPGDFEASRDWSSREAELSRDITIAAGVVEHWQGVVAKLEAEAAEKAKVVERAKLDKEARGVEADRIRRIAVKAADLAEELAASKKHYLDCHAAGVVDAEARIRKKPGTTRPAITETVAAWFDREGNRYGSDQVYDPQYQQWVRATDRERREVVDVIFDDSEIPGHMPDRFAYAIELFDLEGRQIWPR
jgi:hypothetical protein